MGKRGGMGKVAQLAPSHHRDRLGAPFTGFRRLAGKAGRSDAPQSAMAGGWLSDTPSVPEERPRSKASGHGGRRREPLSACCRLAVGLTVMLAGGCAGSAPSSKQAATAAPSAASAASLPLGLPRAPEAPQPTVWEPPDEELLDEEPLAPLALDDTTEPLAVDDTSTGIYERPMRPEPLDHVCPSGTAPYAEITEGRAEPAPGYGERPGSYGHRFLITAAGRRPAAITAAPSAASAASLPLGLPRAPEAPQPTVWEPPDEELLDEEPLAPLALDDTTEPLAVDDTSTGIYERPMRPEPLDHVCPSGTAPYAEITEGRAEPAPGYGERPGSYGHRFLITAAGRVHNGTTGDVSLNVSSPITVTVDGRGTRLDDVRVSRSVPARGSQSWTASGHYTHYGDRSYWRPQLSAAVERWTWTDYRDRNCPR
jgi:hypothetical protein